MVLIQLLVRNNQVARLTDTLQQGISRETWWATAPESSCCMLTHSVSSAVIPCTFVNVGTSGRVRVSTQTCRALAPEGTFQVCAFGSWSTDVFVVALIDVNTLPKKKQLDTYSSQNAQSPQINKILTRSKGFPSKPCGQLHV